VILAYVIAASIVAAPFLPFAAALTGVAALAVLVLLNRRYYAWFLRQRGLWFALRVVPAHVLHHLCNGVSFLVGTAAHLGARFGVPVPWALPTSDWMPASAGATRTRVRR
jgi:hypothetical protein